MMKRRIGSIILLAIISVLFYYAISYKSDNYETRNMDDYLVFNEYTQNIVNKYFKNILPMKEAFQSAEAQSSYFYSYCSNAVEWPVFYIRLALQTDSNERYDQLINSIEARSLKEYYCEQMTYYMFSDDVKEKMIEKANDKIYDGNMLNIAYDVHLSKHILFRSAMLVLLLVFQFLISILALGELFCGCQAANERYSYMASVIASVLTVYLAVKQSKTSRKFYICFLIVSVLFSIYLLLGLLTRPTPSAINFSNLFSQILRIFTIAFFVIEPIVVVILKRNTHQSCDSVTE